MRIRKRYLFYILALSSACASAASAVVDTVVAHEFIANPWVYGLAFFLVAAPLTLLITLIISIPAGKRSIGARIDPSFRRIRFPRKEELLYQMLSALGNAAFTLGYFLVMSRLMEPSVVLSFSQLSILYLLIVESVAEKNAPTMAEVQASLIVAFGAILGSISLSGELDMEALLIVFLVMNPGTVLFAEYQRKLKRLKMDGRPNDAINIRLWNLVFTTFFVFIIVSAMDVKLVAESITASGTALSWISAGVVVTFFSIVLFVRAMGIGKASITQAVRASSIIFAIPFFIALSYVIPDITFVSDPVLLLIRIIGIVLVVMGVISFALTEVKAYIFIRLEPGYPVTEIQQKIWEIKGITSVSATTGCYDIVAKARMRTLGKGYERIIRELEKIRGIKTFEWQTILKEWEEL